MERPTSITDSAAKLRGERKLTQHFKNMLHEGLMPSIETYTTLLNAFRRAGDTVALMKIWKLMIREKIAGTRGGQHLRMPQLLQEMAVLELKPNSVAYSTMIYAFIHSYQKLRSTLDVNLATKSRKDKNDILGIINSKMGMVKARKEGKKDKFWKTGESMSGHSSLNLITLA
ncbi:unnamed protein product [Citrullus colocynthis]|uniref:Pentatricopeptide repeat-containing protein n=1 Tax=Citrullus colocynthis TaxID=252529 RepID=A0ABP0Z322_9ROSI